MNNECKSLFGQQKMVTQFPLLNFHHSSLITHHSFFHTHLATSLLFSSLNFFTLFMGPTLVSRYNFFFFSGLALAVCFFFSFLFLGWPFSFFFFWVGAGCSDFFFYFLIFYISFGELGTKKKKIVPADKCGTHE